MYLLATHIPVYVDGGRTFTEISWQRDILLARDWLAPPFGQLTLLCPSLPLNASDGKTPPLVPIGEQDGVRVIPSFDLRCRARQFWLVQRRQWMADVRHELHSAKVIHCSASDVFRPLWYLAHMAGVKSHATTVLVAPDSDPHLIQLGNLKGQLVCMVFDQLLKHAAQNADLMLLKEGAVHTRYARFARNGKPFCHSMHRSQDVIEEKRLEERLATLERDRPLKAVYAGRFIAQKGMLDAIEAIACAKRKGVMVEYHFWGSGPEEATMRRQVAELGVVDLVHFHGFVEYSPQFISQLAEYDLLLFMPRVEETARVLYDAMAAGLPLLGTRIPFHAHRVAADGIGVLVDVGNSALAGDQLCRLNANRSQLIALSRAAAAAGRRHAVEQWYQRRVEWTQQAAHRQTPAIQTW